jgi:hypothetical protein
MRLAVYVARTEDMRNAYKILVENLSFGRLDVGGKTILQWILGK